MKKLVFENRVESEENLARVLTAVAITHYITGLTGSLYENMLNRYTSYNEYRSRHMVPILAVQTGESSFSNSEAGDLKSIRY